MQFDPFLNRHSLLSAPIAIAYSIWDRSFSLSLSLSVSVCQYSHGGILIDFRQKWRTDITGTVTASRSKNEFVGSLHRTTPSPTLPPPSKNRHFGQKVLKIHANHKHKYANFCPKCSQIAEIPVLYRKSRSTNTTVNINDRKVLACSSKCEQQSCL